MKNYIHQIRIEHSKLSYRKPNIPAGKEALVKELLKRGLKIKLTDALKGGVDSQIYSGELNGENVVVKHTEDRGQTAYNPPFTPLDFFVDRENHNLDTYILQKLVDTQIRVPKVIHHFPEITTTVMEDLRSSGFKLVSEEIFSGKLGAESAKNIAGQMLSLADVSGEWKIFKCFKTPEAQIFERGLELRMAYPNTQKEYLDLEIEFLSRQDKWLWPDGHPKNMFVDNNLNVAFIDFGGSYWGDQRFMLPNFLGQFIVLCNSCDYDSAECLKFIEIMINTYKSFKKINEALICKYTAMEILHRSFGKWVDGTYSVNRKVKNIKLGLTIFDRNVITISNLLTILKKEL